VTFDKETWANMKLRKVLAGMIVLSFIIGAVPLVESSIEEGDAVKTVLASKTLTRADPVVLLGSSIPGYVSSMYGVEHIFVWAFRNGDWRQVVFQIDEALGTFMCKDVPTNSAGPHKNYYIADNGYIDNDDEICFMANETGDQVNRPIWAPGANTTVQRYEIQVTDPLDTTKKGWVYIFYHDTPPVWTTVDYAAWTEATNTVSTYGYSLSYLDNSAKRLGCDVMQVKPSIGGTNVDIVDRSKAVVNVAVSIDAVRSEYGTSTRGLETYYSGLDNEPRYNHEYAIKDGPVRVIRHLRWGFGSSNLFDLTDKMGWRGVEEYKYYSYMYTENEYLSCWTTSAKTQYFYRSIDHAAAAIPMQYYNSVGATGTINGVADETIPTTLMTWDQVSSAQGSYFTKYSLGTWGYEVQNNLQKTTRFIDNSAATDTDGTRTGAEAGRYGEHGYYINNPSANNTWSTAISTYTTYFLPANSANVGSLYNSYTTTNPSYYHTTSTLTSGSTVQSWNADHFPPSTDVGTVLVSGVTSLTVPMSTAGNVVLTARINDTLQGNNNIISAVWTDGFANFPGTAMTADTTFNSPIEAVRATINLASWAAGVHTIYVYGTDALLNLNETSVQHVTITIVDDMPPATTVGTVLVNGAATHTTLFSAAKPVTLNATITDLNRGRAIITSAIWTNGFANFPGTAMAPTDGTFDTLTEAVTATLPLNTWNAGVYQIHVYGTDATPLQNTTSTQKATITITDNVAPAVNSVLLNGVPVLTRTISDYPIINLTALVNDAGKGGSIIAGANYTIGQYNWVGSKPMTPVTPLDTATESFSNQINITGWTPGTYLFYVYGRDSAGNRNITSGQYALLIIENDWAPEVSNVRIDGLATISVPFSIRSPHTLTATLNDTNHGNNMIAGANYTVGMANWPSVRPMTPVGALDSAVEDFTASVDISTWAVGTYDLYAYGWDESNDYNATSQLFARIIIYDDVAPRIDTVRINGLPVFETTNTGAGTITLTAWVDDSQTGNTIIGGANYTVGAAKWGTGGALNPVNALDTTREQFTVARSITGWAAGVYYFYSYGWDTVPNRNSTSQAYATLIIHDVLVPTVSNVRINGTSIFTVDYANATSIQLTGLLDDTGRGNSEIGGANYTLGFRDWPTSAPMATYNDEAVADVANTGIVSSDDYTAPNNYKNTAQLPDDGRYEYIQESIGSFTPTVQGFQASNGGTATSTNLVLAAPTGITAGELLLLIVSDDYATTVSPHFNAVTGWTKLGESGSTTPDAYIGVYWRIATGTEGTVTVTSTTAAYWMGWYIRISGANTTAPINTQNFAISTAAGVNPHVIPQITTTVDNCLAIYGMSFDGGDGAPFSVTSPWTESAEQTNGAATTYNSGCWGTKVQATAGATGTASVTCALIDGAAYFQLAIRPLMANKVDHRWQFDMGSNPTFYIDASNPVGSDSTFKMQWSSNGGAAWNDFTTNIQYAANETNVLKSSTIPLAAYVDTFLVRAVTINPGAVADTFSIDRMWATGQFNNNPEAVYKVIDISTWQPGEYQLYVYGWDKTPQYNTTSRAYATLIITDNLPPEILNFLVNGGKHVTINLSVGSVTFTGTVDDSRTGNADIEWGAYAHENMNYSTGEYMTPNNALDSPVESFTDIVNISGWHAINNTLFMYGGDAVGMNNETSQENVTVNIIDNVAPATTPWSIKLNGGSECWVDPMVTTSVTITATIDDALHGYSNITAAQWAVGPANLTGVGMLPVGGLWNNYTKQVTGTINFASWIPGTYYIYVYGTDSKGNAQTVITSYAILYLDNNGPAIEGPWAGATLAGATLTPYIWITGTSFTIKAYGDDRARGRSNVVCAEYFVDTVGANGTGISMANVGFRFDSPYEGAKATISCSGWLPGEFHTYYIHFQDAMGEWGDMGSVLVMKQGNGFILPIQLGWNLISLPMVTASANIRDILAGISWDRAYIYDPQNPNPWLSHGSTRPAEVNDFIAVDITMGIWVNVTSITVNHIDISGGTPGVTQITLHAGWNLVGYSSMTNRLASNALAGTGADRIAVFNSTYPSLMQDITDLSTVTMSAGNGYWVHVTADTVWTINP
jgi:hypothetical protein